MMDEISGKQLDKLPYADIRKVADLTYVDGPLLSLFRDFDGQNYLYHWCDSDDICNRWLVYQITNEQFENYVTKALTFREMSMNPLGHQIFVVDIDGEGNHTSVITSRPEDLPDDYFPRKGTYYDPGTTVFYEQDACSHSLHILINEIQKLRNKHPHFSYYTVRTNSHESLSSKGHEQWGFNADNMHDETPYVVSFAPNFLPNKTNQLQYQ